MKISLTLFILLFSLTILQPASAETMLYVKEAFMAAGIEDLTPTGVAESFPPDVKKVYCYSKIAGGEKGDHIKHIWYYSDRVMAEVKLDIGSPLFRTYSSKIILPLWTGPWKVEIVTDDGTVLKTLYFAIE